MNSRIARRAAEEFSEGAESSSDVSSSEVGRWLCGPLEEVVVVEEEEEGDEMGGKVNTPLAPVVGV